MKFFGGLGRSSFESLCSKPFCEFPQCSYPIIWPQGKDYLQFKALEMQI